MISLPLVLTQEFKGNWLKTKLCLSILIIQNRGKSYQCNDIYCHIKTALRFGGTAYFKMIKNLNFDLNIILSKNLTYVLGNLQSII